MNGEVSQICRIVAAARAAIRDDAEFRFTPLKYEGSTTFNFCDRSNSGAPMFRAKDPADWFAHLKTEGMKNVFMIAGMNVQRRGVGLSNNSATSIFVRYNDNVVTRFEPRWSFNDDERLWSIEYTEHLASGAPEKDPEFRDESSLLEASLKDMAKLAEKIDEPGFAKTFRKAVDILTGEAAPKLKEGAVLPQIPEDRLNIYLAADVADVFGTMGSWNDEPVGKAYSKGLDKDFNTLSDRLFCSIRLMLMYSVNFPI